MKDRICQWVLTGMAAAALFACQPGTEEEDEHEPAGEVSDAVDDSAQASQGATAAQRAPAVAASCGDGLCRTPETYESCPLDCPPFDPPFQETILQNGDNWQLKKLQGSARNATGQMEAFTQNYWVIHPGGLSAAPISPTIKQELINQGGNPRDVVTASAWILEEIERSIAQGRLTGGLLIIAEPDDSAPPVRSSPSDKKGEPELGVMAQCSDKIYTKSSSFSLSTPLNISTSVGGGFTGSLSASGNAQASATGELLITTKRLKLFGVCVPYAVKSMQVHAFGSANLVYNSTLSGNLSYAGSWQWELIKIPLFSLNFFAGPLPVHIGFNLPIDYGLDLQASVTGNVSFTGAQSSSGSFDYLCATGGCTGSSSYTQNLPTSSPAVTGAISGRIQPNIWVQAAFRGYLYSEWIAYAQLGVRPYLRGDLWGYYGNSCGDADADGILETVDALALDLDLQVRLTGQASLLNATPTQWTLWQSPRYHRAFWDLIGSEALQPMLGGSATASATYAQPYTARMRPCYPWSDAVSYKLDWGDGTPDNSVSGAPATLSSAVHAWAAMGTRTVSLLAISDAHGRIFNKSMSRLVKVGPPPVWTSWLNRDNPGGAGDYETRADFVPAVCSAPLAVQCQTFAGLDPTQTGEVYSCTPSNGGVCRNADQSDGMCQDYRVRFLCP